MTTFFALGLPIQWPRAPCFSNTVCACSFFLVMDCTYTWLVEGAIALFRMSAIAIVFTARVVMLIHLLHLPVREPHHHLPHDRMADMDAILLCAAASSKDASDRDV